LCPISNAGSKKIDTNLRSHVQHRFGAPLALLGSEQDACKTAS